MQKTRIAAANVEVASSKSPLPSSDPSLQRGTQWSRKQALAAFACIEMSWCTYTYAAPVNFRKFDGSKKEGRGNEHDY